MRQMLGYAIAKKPAVLLAEYEASWFAEQNREPLTELRRALGFLDPAKYRGVSRAPLMPYPSLDSAVLDEFRKSGIDLDTDAPARIRFLELVGEQRPMDYDDDLLDTPEQAREVFSLLKTPSDNEIVLFRRDTFEPGANTLGFDIGYWAGDHYSIVCDVAVMPRWHPPVAADLSVLSQRLRPLNSNVLFDTPSEAETFLAWYRGRPWAEGESPDARFFVTQVDEVPV